MKAGFMQGCASDSRGLVDCGCLLDALSATPAYNTPERFAALSRELQSAGGDPADPAGVRRRREILRAQRAMTSAG